jgi:hypothetical protein
MSPDGTMTAMVLDRFGGNFRAEERPVPRPGHGEVLVDVVACGVGLTLEHGRLGLLGGSTPGCSVTSSPARSRSWVPESRCGLRVIA